MADMGMTEFFAMGGYAAFVWPAIGLSALVMAALYIQSHRALRASEAELEALRSERTHEAET